MPAPKKPQDHKTKAVQAEADGADYEFTGNDGKTYSLPSFRNIKSGTLRKIRNQGEVDQMYTLLEDFADEETLTAIDDFNMTELIEFFRGWERQAGMSLPKP